MTKNITLAVARVQITVLENKVWSTVQESSAEIQSTEYRWLNGNLPLATSGHWEQVKPGTQQQLPPSHVCSNRLMKVLNKFDKVVTLTSVAHFCYLGQELFIIAIPTYYWSTSTTFSDHTGPQYWHNIDTTLIQLCDNYETTLAKLWHNFATTMRQLRQNFGTTLWVACGICF